jgi:hypothetical protein
LYNEEEAEENLFLCRAAAAAVMASAFGMSRYTQPQTTTFLLKIKFFLAILNININSKK